ncbi:hypothetical protein TSIB_0760 [Thermococcus sibiricus MM 739]|uniref:Uncharacterized protein n=1 Tax=Thermococcus sibiricus (strain DSM 12597 / MM 739) TaxID=604354 RepID=C6A2H6_THESM|nr:hypothetical protein TSIB_0760 [Thermococcus sibiricus MM 739]
MLEVKFYRKRKGVHSLVSILSSFITPLWLLWDLVTLGTKNKFYLENMY